MKEIWKQIDGTDGMIEVSNFGRVRSLLRGKPYILKRSTDKKGYQRIRFTINRKKMCIKVHREVAKAFIPNPNNFPQVNHIDCNKANNSVSNLEWISNAGNVHHAISSGLWDKVYAGARKVNDARKKKIVAICGEEEMEFCSVRDAERKFSSRHITDVLKGKRTHVKGWKFVYKEVVTNGSSETSCPKR